MLFRSLMRRIEETNKSARNTWEALTGTIVNFWAAMGGPMVTSLYPYIKAVNDFVGGPMMEWVKQNENLVKWLGLGALAVGGLLVVLGGLGIILGAVGQGVGFAVGGLKILWSICSLLVSGIGLLARGLTMLIPVVGRLLITAFLAAARASWAFTISLLANPITWIIAGIIALGVAIYMLVKHWDAVKAATQRFWSWFRSLVGRIGTAVGQAVSNGWNATKMAISNAVTSMEEVGSKLLSVFTSLPGKLFKAGAAMMDMFIAGVKSKIAAVVDTVTGVTERIRGFFNRSPAKEGPLKDIHQHKFSEMVALAIRPEPIVNAVRAVTSAGLLALAPLTSPAMASLSSPAMVASAHASATPRPALAKIGRAHV